MQQLQNILTNAANISLWEMAVLAYVITTAVSDIRWRKIPRAITTAAFLAGIAYHAFAGGVFWALAAGVIGFGLGIVFFRLGAIGGGDVKLITALGAMLGLDDWLVAMQVAIFTAALVALAQAIHEGRLRRTLANTFTAFRWVLSSGVQPHPEINVTNTSSLRAPFGVAAAIGVLIAVVRV